MFIDIAVGLLIIVALFLGYQRGVIQPLMAEIFFFGTLLLVFRFHDQYTTQMEKLVHINAVISVFVALIAAVILGAVGGAVGGAFHRMESIRGIDGLLGIFVHVIVMLIVIYLGISALVTLDNAFVPTVNKATLTLDQVNELESTILSNPITSALVSKDDLAALKKAGPIDERREHPEHQRHQAAGADLHELPRAAAAQLSLGAGHPQHRPAPAAHRARRSARPAPGSVPESRRRVRRRARQGPRARPGRPRRR